MRTARASGCLLEEKRISSTTPTRPSFESTRKPSQVLSQYARLSSSTEGAFTSPLSRVSMTGSTADTRSVAEIRGEARRTIRPREGDTLDLVRRHDQEQPYPRCPGRTASALDDPGGRSARNSTRPRHRGNHRPFQPGTPHREREHRAVNRLRSLESETSNPDRCSFSASVCAMVREGPAREQICRKMLAHPPLSARRSVTHA